MDDVKDMLGISEHPNQVTENVVHAEENTIAKILRSIGIATMIICGIGGFILGSDDFGFVWSFALYTWIAGFISGMLFIGLGEIIRLLHIISLKN